MPFCNVKWCGKSSTKNNFEKDGITFHRFPDDPGRKSLWIDACHRDDKWFPTRTATICSRHFTADCFFQMKKRRRLLASALPTLCLPILSDSEHTVPGGGDDISLCEHVDVASCSAAALKIREEDNIEASVITHRMKMRIGDNFTASPHHPESAASFEARRNKILCRRILELSERDSSRRKQLKRLKGRIDYLNKKVATLKNIVRQLTAATQDSKKNNTD